MALDLGVIVERWGLQNTLLVVLYDVRHVKYFRNLYSLLLERDVGCAEFGTWLSCVVSLRFYSVTNEYVLSLHTRQCCWRDERPACSRNEVL